MRDRVRRGDETAVREPEQVDLLFAEVDAQLLDVSDVVLEKVCLRFGAAAGTARVDQQQRSRRVEAAEIE